MLLAVLTVTVNLLLHSPSPSTYAGSREAEADTSRMQHANITSHPLISYERSTSLATEYQQIALDQLGDATHDAIEPHYQAVTKPSPPSNSLANERPAVGAMDLSAHW